jgi:hypothetical protein
MNDADENSQRAAGANGSDESENTDAQDADSSAAAGAYRSRGHTALVLFGIFILAGAGFYMMYLRSGPARAKGAVVGPTATETAVRQFLSEGERNKRAMWDKLLSTQSLINRCLHFYAVLQVPLNELRANPFHFAQMAQTAPPTADDSRIRRAQMRADALKTVQGLRLQSVVLNANRRACMIDNSLCTEGQQIKGCTIEKIAAGSVIVRCATFRFELRMGK